MKKIETINKKIGETPLQTIERFRILNSEYKNEKISYAGRLDPMAEGVLLLVIGEENKEKQKYLNLEKEYTFDILFGFETDTFDILGKVTNISNKKIGKGKLEQTLKTFIGDRTQKYPPFSSKRVFGKALFKWAREGRLNEISIPTNKINISEIKLINMKEILSNDLQESILSKIELLKGYDFRQDEIVKIWKENFKKNKEESFTVATINIKCSSGTYVRRLVNELGEKLGIPTTTLHILRERVGNYTIKKT